MAKKKQYEDGSIMYWAVQGFSNIKKLSESGLISEKLLGLNTLVFSVLLAILFAGNLGDPSELFSLSFGLIFLLSFAFGLGLSNIYSPILSVIAGFSKDKVESLRIGLVVLFIAVPIAVAGLIYQVDILTQISVWAIIVQLVLVMTGAVFQFSKQIEMDVNVNPKQVRVVLHDVAAVLGILSFIITAILLVVGANAEPVQPNEIIKYQCVDGSFADTQDACPPVDCTQFKSFCPVIESNETNSSST
jgi:hypothetical protein